MNDIVYQFCTVYSQWYNKWLQIWLYLLLITINENTGGLKLVIETVDMYFLMQKCSYKKKP